jgi:hypothetical protein
MTNGNVSAETIYTSNMPGQPDQQQADVQYKYASSANPALSYYHIRCYRPPPQQYHADQ